MGDISDFMSRDHDRLDEIFAEFRKEHDEAEAKALFAQFDAGLRAHIGWEEEILFPAFEGKTGMTSGPTAVMRMEHRRIEELLQAIQAPIDAGDPSDAAAGLIEILTAHNQKEESVLYPWLDGSLSAEERTAVLERIKEAVK